MSDWKSLLNRQSLTALLVFLGVTFLAAIVGSRFLPGTWYAGLTKPALNPPNWVFGPVWSVLYVMMGLAAWLVWQTRATRPVHLPLVMYGAQLILNCLWSYLFFGLNRPGLAFVDIAALWIAILATMILFFSRSRIAGFLFGPYFLWVTFAAYLNWAIWRLNPA